MVIESIELCIFYRRRVLEQCLRVIILSYWHLSSGKKKMQICKRNTQDIRWVIENQSPNYDLEHKIKINALGIRYIKIIIKIKILTRKYIIYMWKLLFVCLLLLIPSNLFQCDSCGEDPLRGTRWHCDDCAVHGASYDLCCDCLAAHLLGETEAPSPPQHGAHHRFRPVRSVAQTHQASSSSTWDPDYLAPAASYNYLDPNFMPDWNKNWSWLSLSPLFIIIFIILQTLCVNFGMWILFKFDM